MSRKITLESQKALIKYFDVIIKAGSERDIKNLYEIMLKIKEDLKFNFNDDVVRLSN
jgi:hypothetical protein